MNLFLEENIERDIMKKRAFVILMSAALAGVTAGCGPFSELVTDRTEKVEDQTSDENEEEKESSDDSQEVTEEETGDAAEDVVEEGFAHDSMLPYAYDADTIYTVDDKGNKKGVISLSVVNDAIKKLIDSKEDITGYMIKAVSGDIVFVYRNPYDEESSAVYAVDTKTGEASLLLDTQYNVSYVDAYKGKVYIGVSKYRSGDDDTMDFEEYVVSEKEDGSGFDIEENIYDNLEPYYPQYSFVETHANINYDSFDYCHGFSLKRVMDNCGFVVVHKAGDLTGGYSVIDADGNQTDLDVLHSAGRVNVLAYDKDWMIYVLTSEDGREKEYNLYNFAKETSTPIDIENVGYVEMYSGGCHFVSNSEEFGSNAFDVCDYDFNSGNMKKIFSKENFPLSERNTAFACIFGENLFYQKTADDGLKWYRKDLSADDGEGQDMDCVIKKTNVYSYGKITFDTVTQKCPKCGIPLYKNYDEIFALDSKYSDHADEINTFFVNQFQRKADDTLEESAIGDTTCEEHQEYPEQYCETVESYVEDVNILNDRYLAVDYSSYWYGGGAHGMPGKDQYIFDLQTGKQMTTRDFYSGSEEDFKRLVAEKTKEDYLKTQDEYKYFAENADEAYNTAYEYARLDATVFFKEDRVIYSFMPYDMGPFSSGFIDIELPISEFDLQKK